MSDVQATTTEDIKVDYRQNNTAIVMDGTSAFTFEVMDNPRQLESHRPKRDSLDWNDNHYNINGWRILPYGDNNDLPREIQQAVQNNAFAPGMLEKMVGLLWGKGPRIYTEKGEGENVYRELVNDPVVSEWLKTWEYEDYILRCCESYSYMQGFFTKLYRNKAQRIALGKDTIAKLEHVGVESSRLASEYVKNTLVPSHIVETDFSFNSVNSLTDMKVYPIFDVKNPFTYPTTMYYANKYTFGSKTYTIPKLTGNLNWLRRSTAVPIILEAFTDNSINAKYHIQSPQEFWDQQEEKLKALATKKGVEYEDSMLDEYRMKLLKGIAKVLGSPENAGKFWHSVKIIIDGQNLLESGWEIKEIPQNIKEFAEAHIAISKHSIQNVTAGVGVHAANANVSESGKSDSGSEQLYAHQNHKLTSNAIPEMIIMKPINMVLEINFPGKDYKMGFFHEAAQRQQDLTESERHINKQ